MSERKTHVIIIAETVLQSWARDLFSLVVMFALIGLGKWIDSGVMQFIGAVGAIIFIASRESDERRSMTIAEARARLDQIERGER